MVAATIVHRYHPLCRYPHLLLLEGVRAAAWVPPTAALLDLLGIPVPRARVTVIGAPQVVPADLLDLLHLVDPGRNNDSKCQERQEAVGLEGEDQKPVEKEVPMAIMDREEKLRGGPLRLRSTSGSRATAAAARIGTRV